VPPAIVSLPALPGANSEPSAKVRLAPASCAYVTPEKVTNPLPKPTCRSLPTWVNCSCAAAPLAKFSTSLPGTKPMIVPCTVANWYVVIGIPPDRFVGRDGAGRAAARGTPSARFALRRCRPGSVCVRTSPARGAKIGEPRERVQARTPMRAREAEVLEKMSRKTSAQVRSLRARGKSLLSRWPAGHGQRVTLRVTGRRVADRRIEGRRVASA
jgi:hypothetical protein